MHYGKQFEIGFTWNCFMKGEWIFCWKDCGGNAASQEDILFGEILLTITIGGLSNNFEMIKKSKVRYLNGIAIVLLEFKPNYDEYNYRNFFEFFLTDNYYYSRHRKLYCVNKFCTRYNAILKFISKYHYFIFSNCIIYINLYWWYDNNDKKEF